MEQGLLQACVFLLAFFWFALFSKSPPGRRAFMCVACVLILWWMRP